MKEAFEAHNFREKTLELIGLMDHILTEYAQQGYVLTVRQLYYQMVARDYIPNNLRSYKRLVNHCANARKAGLLDWGRLHDTARRTIYPSSWSSPKSILTSAANQFRLDRWEGQSERVFVMVEKEALSGILAGPCEDLHVRLYPNRGYTSLSFAYNVGRMIKWMDEDDDLNVHIIYLGDHDPSGMDMDRDIGDRLSMFSRYTPFTFERIALTMEQIEEYDPPPDPAKLTDSRAPEYIYNYGHESWELDALQPGVLVSLVTEKIEEHIDQDIWDETMEREAEYKERLQEMADEFEGDEEE